MATIADILMAQGAQAAQTRERLGQIQAQTWGSIGHTIAGLPQEIAQQRVAQEEAQARQMQLAELQRRQQDLQSLDQAYAQPGGRDTILETIRQTPGGAHLVPQVSEQFDKADKAAADLRNAHLEFVNKAQDYVGNLALDVKRYGYDPAHAQLALAHAKETFANDPQMLSQLTGLEQQMHATPDASTVKGLFEPLIPAKLVELSQGGSVVDVNRGTTEGTGARKPMNMEELAIDAATLGTPGETATAANSKLAVDRLKPPKSATETAAQMDADYQTLVEKRSLGQRLTPQEQATITAYERRKTLGPLAYSQSAEDRQQKSENFQEQERGREHMMKEVDTPYNTSLATSEELRGLVDAARAGNKEAASLQNLQAAMSAIRANGLNRINTTEIGMPASAGNLFDQIASKVGKLTTGQSVPDDLQKDLIDYADILDRSAYKKYSDQFETVTKRYNLSDETKKAAPQGAPVDRRAAAAAYLEKNQRHNDPNSVTKFLQLNPNWTP